ncbi:MAG: hypothetical protein KC656_38305, partial [Myxococcales bacterium]|nr:hypothetical protein [Myxococcales bacterium]
MNEGVLVRHAPQAAADLLADLVAGRARTEERTLVAARLDDGRRLLAVNEVYVGHRTHQSARYVIHAGGQRERHSSSGLICATGTGSTGWARSIRRQRAIEVPEPAPEERRLDWFVREPFPSVATGTSLEFGSLAEGERLVIDSLMGEDGVAFADGIEPDRIEF